MTLSPELEAIGRAIDTTFSAFEAEFIGVVKEVDASADDLGHKMAAKAGAALRIRVVRDVRTRLIRELAIEAIGSGLMADDNEEEEYGTCPTNAEGGTCETGR